MSPTLGVRGQRGPAACFSRLPALLCLITSLGPVPRLGVLEARWRPSRGAPHCPPTMRTSSAPTTTKGPSQTGPLKSHPPSSALGLCLNSWGGGSQGPPRSSAPQGSDPALPQELRPGEQVLHRAASHSQRVPTAEPVRTSPRHQPHPAPHGWLPCRASVSPQAPKTPFFGPVRGCPCRPHAGTPRRRRALSHGALPPGIPAFPIKGRVLPSAAQPCCS